MKRSGKRVKTESVMNKLYKNTGYIFSLILIVCLLMFSDMLSCFAVSSKTPSIVIDSARGKAGDTVDVTITMSDNPGFISANLYVNYDEDLLTLKNVKDGGLLSGVTHSGNYTSPYGLCWVNDLAKENFKVNGVLATLTFEISKNAKPGKTTISLEQDILNCDIENVVFELGSGSVEIGNSSEKSDSSDSSSDNSQNSANSENKSSDKSDSSNNSDNGSGSVSNSSDNSSSVSDVNSSEKSESGNSEVSSESNSESDLSSATSDSAQNQGSGSVVLWLITGGLILVAVLIFIGAFVYKKRKNQAE